MKSAHLKLITSLFLIVASQASSATTLREAIEQAYQHVPGLKAQQSSVRAAEHGVRVERSTWWPQLSLSATGTNGRYDNTASRGRGVDGFDHNTSHNVQFLASQRLFDYKLTRGLVSAAEFGYKQEQATLHGVKENIAKKVTSAYIDVLRFQELAQIAQKNVAESDKLFAIIQKQVRNGRTAKVDVYLAQTQVSATNAQLVSQQGSLRDAEIRYAELTGQAPQDLAMVSAPPSLASLEEAMLQAMQNHPNIKSAQTQAEAARATNESRRSAWWPRVDLELFSRHSENESAVKGTDNNRGVNLVMQWDFYDGGRSLAESKRTQTELTSSLHNIDEARREITQDIRLSWSDLETTQSRLKHAQTQASADEKVYKAYQSQLMAGRRSPLDVFVVLRGRHQSRLQAKGVSWEVLKKQYQVLAAMGQLESAVQ